ncbi:MAG: hypothetical protein KBC27_00435 [Rickettsiales bacterium]|nr:hypothetical protein [Rickettsiales bacterium]
MNKIFQSVILVMLFLTASCTNLTSVRHRNDYEKTLKKTRVLSLLPVKAEVKMVGVDGDHNRMYDYEYEVEKIIFRSVKPILAKKGYKVALVSKRALKDKNIFSYYDMLSEDLDKELLDLYSAPMMDTDKAYKIENKIGRHAFVVGKGTKGDVIVFINYLNNVKTNSARVAAFMTDVLLKTNNTSEVDKATIIISLIDAKNGNILWSNCFAVSTDLFEDMFRGKDQEFEYKRVDSLMSGVLKPLPNRRELLDKIADAA